MNSNSAFSNRGPWEALPAFAAQNATNPAVERVLNKSSLYNVMEQANRMRCGGKVVFLRRFC